MPKPNKPPKPEKFDRGNKKVKTQHEILMANRNQILNVVPQGTQIVRTKPYVKET